MNGLSASLYSRIADLQEGRKPAGSLFTWYHSAMEKRERPELLEFNAENRPSSFAIEREGERIVLTNGEVYEATESLLHRISADALLFFADAYVNDIPYEKRKMIEDNLVRSILNGITRETLEMANKEMGRDKAVPIDQIFGF